MNKKHVQPGLSAAFGRFNTVGRYPGYTAFLARHGLRAEMIVTEEDFASLPPMTKEDLLVAWPLGEQLEQQDASEPSMVVASSGSSGQPIYMLRGAGSFQTGIEVFDRLFRNVYGTTSRSTLVIVCFAFGTWVGGTYVLLALLALRARGHRITVIPPGVDLASARDALVRLGPLFEQVVIAGYPPHVREVLDQTPAEALCQDIRLLIGGEPTSEDVRDHMLGRLGHPVAPELVTAVYGASELAFVGNETRLTITVRRAARDDARLAAVVFDNGRPASGWSGVAGDEDLVQPTLVEYDPTVCFIEADEDGYLLFTVEATVPLVRYRVYDQGAVFDSDEFAAVLRAAARPDLAAQVNPDAGYLVMYGRTDVAAIFGGANIFPGQIQPALDDPVFADHVTGKFVASIVGGRLQIRVELGDGVTADDQLAVRLARAVSDKLIRTCSEYRVLRERGSVNTEPVIVLDPHGSPAFPSTPKQRRVDPDSET